MSERLKFIEQLLRGERMADACRAFGISRKTGYKVWQRWQASRELRDGSRRPYRSPHRTPRAVAEEVVRLRRRHPSWGPRKLKARLEELQPEVRWPAASTIGAILKDADLVKARRRRRRTEPNREPLRESSAPNELWCMDFKGQFRLGNGSYCYPLTVTDHYSRYLLGCEALEGTRSFPTRAALMGVFGEYGLPDAVRTDNGTPFASTGRCGLSKLSVWLMRLGVAVERIEPGKPQQNGRHERMHLTLKEETTRPSAHSVLRQQERFDAFRKVYNEERPHEALSMKPPSSVYRPTKRPLDRDPPPLTYPLHDQTRLVANNGHMHLTGVGHVCVGAAFSGQHVGLRQIQSGTWLVTFMDLDIGYLEEQSRTIFDIPNDSGPDL